MPRVPHISVSPKLGCAFLKGVHSLTGGLFLGAQPRVGPLLVVGAGPWGTESFLQSHIYVCRLGLGPRATLGAGILPGRPCKPGLLLRLQSPSPTPPWPCPQGWTPRLCTHLVLCLLFATLCHPQVLAPLFFPISEPSLYPRTCFLDSSPG